MTPGGALCATTKVVRLHRKGLTLPSQPTKSKAGFFQVSIAQFTLRMLLCLKFEIDLLSQMVCLLEAQVSADAYTQPNSIAEIIEQN